MPLSRAWSLLQSASERALGSTLRISFAHHVSLSTACKIGKASLIEGNNASPNMCRFYLRHFSARLYISDSLCKIESEKNTCFLGIHVNSNWTKRPKLFPTQNSNPHTQETYSAFGVQMRIEGEVGGCFNGVESFPLQLCCRVRCLLITVAHESAQNPHDATHPTDSGSEAM